MRLGSDTPLTDGDTTCTGAAVPLGVGRSLKTAAEALAALRLLGANPDGVTAERLATSLGKSTSTARYLLNTLCQEGYATKEGSAGVHHLVETPPWGGAWGLPEVPARHELPERLFDAVTELYLRTRQRAYLAQWRDGATVVVDARGHQGLARIPELAERIPSAQAPALAVTKELVAGCEFCFVSAPILAPDGSVAASLAVSTPAPRFARESGAITRAVAEIATAASREWRAQSGAPP